MGGLRLYTLLLLPAFPVQATEVDIFGGTEYFLWEEFADDGNKLLEETGPRYYVGVVGTNHLNPGWSIDFGGRLYSGSVDYEGQTQQPQSLPVTTQTDYNGYRLALSLTYYTRQRQELPNGEWLLHFAYGHDYWRRSLRDTTVTSNGQTYQVNGYEERYQSDYLMMGFEYQKANAWSVDFGVKAPLGTTERVSGFSAQDEVITLQPEGRLSLYAGAEYAITPAMGVSIDYDSYRFAKSDPVRVESLGGEVYQPESTQATLGVTLHYRF